MLRSIGLLQFTAGLLRSRSAPVLKRSARQSFNFQRICGVCGLHSTERGMISAGTYYHKDCYRGDVRGCAHERVIDGECSDCFKVFN